MHPHQVLIQVSVAIREIVIKKLNLIFISFRDLIILSFASNYLNFFLTDLS